MVPEVGQMSGAEVATLGLLGQRPLLVEADKTSDALNVLRMSH